MNDVTEAPKPKKSGVRKWAYWFFGFFAVAGIAHLIHPEPNNSPISQTAAESAKAHAGQVALMASKHTKYGFAANQVTTWDCSGFATVKFTDRGTFAAISDNDYKAAGMYKRIDDEIAMHTTVNLNDNSDLDDYRQFKIQESGSSMTLTETVHTYHGSSRPTGRQISCTTSVAPAPAALTQQRPTAAQPAAQGVDPESARKQQVLDNAMSMEQVAESRGTQVCSNYAEMLKGVINNSLGYPAAMIESRLTDMRDSAPDGCL
jgi:hypothetical protein